MSNVLTLAALLFAISIVIDIGKRSLRITSYNNYYTLSLKKLLQYRYHCW